jgi:hypothetical protein
MACSRRVFRALTWAGATFLAIIVCAAAVVPVQQRLFRHRAERLLTDMQAIELHKTTWAEAQELMYRWGAWAHYDGTCTSTNCKYTISLCSWNCRAIYESESRFARVARYLLATRAYGWLGGRTAAFRAGFIVQDGIIWRTFIAINVDVPPHTERNDDDSAYELMGYAQSRDSLNRQASPRHPYHHWILGDDSQLAEHPYYKGGRPGGCEICMSVEVTYSNATPQDEIRRLTAFDLSCLTRWRPCTRVEDILPASRPWHLYSLEEDPPLPESVIKQPAACATPAWALGRDAAEVYAVEVQSTATEKSKFAGDPYEIAHARLLETLKGKTPWPRGSELEVLPYSGDEAPERMEMGKRYLVLVRYLYYEWGDPPFIDGKPGISLDRCGVLADTPQNRSELARGFAQNDSLRIAEF